MYYVLSCSADQQSIADLLSRCKRQRLTPLALMPDRAGYDRADRHEIPHAGYIGGVTVGSHSEGVRGLLFVCLSCGRKRLKFAF